MAAFEHFPYFGPAVRLVRDLRGLTQEALANRLDIKPVTVGKYENNLSRPSLEDLGRLLEALGITLEGLGALMRVLEEVATGAWPGGFQYELWPGGDSEIREPGDRDWVARILCLTDRGKLVAVDDVRLNQWLNSSLETLNPKREVVLTLKASPSWDAGLR